MSVFVSVFLVKTRRPREDLGKRFGSVEPLPTTDWFACGQGQDIPPN